MTFRTKAQRLAIFTSLGLAFLALLVLSRAPLTSAQSPAIAASGPVKSESQAALTSSEVITGRIGRLELVGHIGGEMQAVFGQGDLAYVGEGPRLTILDVSDPASPVVLGKTALWPAIVKDTTVHGDYAYVTLGLAGLRVVDVSDPTAPVEVGAYEGGGGSCEEVVVVGDVAYLGGSSLRVVDVSEPSAPTEVGSYHAGRSPVHIAVSGDYVYLTRPSMPPKVGSLDVVDVSDPANPTRVARVEGGDPRDVAVAPAGDYVYVAYSTGHLYAMDISDPEAPTVAGHYAGAASRVEAAGSYVYVLRGQGLVVLNMSDPSAPQVAGAYDSVSGVDAYTADLMIAGDYAYLAGGEGRLEIVDISDVSSPVEISRSESLEDAGRITVVSGTHAYIVDDEASVRVIDVSNPLSPTARGVYRPSAGRVNDVDIAPGDTYAYVTAGDGLHVVDVSDPVSPTEVAFHATPDWAKAVAVSGGYAYVGDSDRYLHVIDVSNPLSPTETGDCFMSQSVDRLVVSGTHVYAAAMYSLRVVDVSDPANPAEVGAFYPQTNPPDPVNDVAVLSSTLPGETYAYLATNRGLRVLDISNPVTPTEVSFYEISGSAESVTVAPGVGPLSDRIYAYVADRYKGLRVVDVSDPVHPTEVSFYDPTEFAYDVDIFRDDVGGYLYAYLTLGSGGLRVLDVSYLSGPEGIGSYEAMGTLQYVTVADGRAYVGDNNENLWTVNVAQPMTPTILGRYKASDLVNDVAMAPGASYLYVATDLDLRAVDVSHPVTPTEVGIHEPLWIPKAIAVATGVGGTPGYPYACLAAYDGLEVVDVSNPFTPTEVGAYKTPGYAYGVDVVPGMSYAYVADRHGGLRVVDVSNPVTPTEVAHYDTPGDVNEVVISGTLAYAATHDLLILDVSDPLSPTELGTYVPPSYVANVALAPGGNYAYITTDEDGLRVVNVSNPEHPVEVSHYETLATAHVAAEGAYVYVASGAAGLFILEPIIYPETLYLPLVMRSAGP
jgi:hypothetical protein